MVRKNYKKRPRPAEDTPTEQAERGPKDKKPQRTKPEFDDEPMAASPTSALYSGLELDEEPAPIPAADPREYSACDAGFEWSFVDRGTHSGDEEMCDLKAGDAAGDRASEGAGHKASEAANDGAGDGEVDGAEIEGGSDRAVISPFGKKQVVYAGKTYEGHKARKAEALSRTRSNFKIRVENLLDRSLQPVSKTEQGTTPKDPIDWKLPLLNALSKFVGLCKYPYEVNVLLFLEVCTRNDGQKTSSSAIRVQEVWAAHDKLRVDGRTYREVSIDDYKVSED